MAACGCARQVVTRSSGCKAIFRGLDPGEEFFPMVARAGIKTFFGDPPNPVTPRPARIRRSARLQRLTRIRRLARTSRPRTRATAVVGSQAAIDLEFAEPMSSSKHDGDDDANNALDWRQDEKTWRTWHKEELPRIVSRLFYLPTRGCRSKSTVCKQNEAFLSSE